MDHRAALELLGLSPGAGPDEVRRAYRRLVVESHPDVSDAADATVRTVALTEAYALLRHGAPEPAPQRDGGRPVRPEDPGAAWDGPPVEVSLVDDDTLAVGAPADTTLLLLVEAAHELGDVVYLDPSSGLVEVLVEFVEAPTCSVLLTLQGRANGTTEVFCTVETLAGDEPPPVDAVVRLVAATVSAVADPSDA